MLDPRAQHLLKTLVERYVIEGQPVGSRVLSKQSGLELSPATIRNLFRNEPGVLRLQGVGSACGKRSYTTFSIPESVALRVRERLTQEPLQAQLPRRNPRRVVFLRNRNRRVA